MSISQVKQRCLIDGKTIPKLADKIRLHYDGAREQWVLLAPERVLQLVGPAADIIRHCDGAKTVEELVAIMSAEYNAPDEEIQSDILEMLQSLLDKRFLQI